MWFFYSVADNARSVGRGIVTQYPLSGKAILPFVTCGRKASRQLPMEVVHHNHMGQGTVNANRYTATTKLIPAEFAL